MIGIADSETAQLNLLNIGVQPPGVGYVCTATVSFVNAAGTVLKSATLTVLPGQSASLSLRSDTDLSLLPGDRRDVRARIAIPGILTPTASTTSSASSGVPSICNLIPTLEVFDTVTGKTLVTLGHVETVPPAPIVTP
jgi:hypothetical protein